MELVLKAEGKDDMSFVMKANGMKRKTEEKSKNVSSVEEAIAIISEKKRKTQNKIWYTYYWHVSVIFSVGIP